LLNRGHSNYNILGYDILTILLISVIIGALHINFGLLIGFYNVFVAHGLKHAIFEKVSWFVLEAGVALIVLSLLKMIVWPVWVGVIIFIISLIMLFIGEGVRGLIEFPALFSNMLSYMRLGAVGLASLGLAVVVNENFAKPLLAKGGFSIIAAILIMIIGHAINIALGVIGPFLHGVRLHYVEFFTKFFHGGGVEFKPFGYKTKSGGK